MNSELKPFPLRTDRLLLREYRDDDAAAIHGYASDPEITRHTAWGPNDITTTKAVLDAWLDQKGKWPREEVPLAVELQPEGKVIGSTGFSAIDFDTLTAVFGYVLHKDHWGKGYALEIVTALLDFGFETLALHRITAECFAEAESACRVLERAGMRREGEHRQNARKWGEWRDTMVFAILAEEWRGLKAKRASDPVVTAEFLAREAAEEKTPGATVSGPVHAAA